MQQVKFDEIDFHVDRNTGVAVLTLNRSEVHNALNATIRYEMNKAVELVAVDEDIRALVLTGSGTKSFSVGADLKSPDSNHSVSEFDKYVAGKSHKTEWYDALCHYPKAVISAVNGYCAGSGLQLALTADIMIGSQTATFWVPQVSLGLAPHVGTMIKLARMIGQQRMLEMILTGRRIDAQEALRFGLLSEVVDQGELVARARAIAARIAQQPPLAVRITKEAYFQGIELTWEQAMRVDGWKEFCMWQTTDRRQRHQDFADRKRPPATRT